MDLDYQLLLFLLHFLPSSSLVCSALCYTPRHTIICAAPLHSFPTLSAFYRSFSYYPEFFWFSSSSRPATPPTPHYLNLDEKCRGCILRNLLANWNGLSRFFSVAVLTRLFGLLMVMDWFFYSVTPPLLLSLYLSCLRSSFSTIQRIRKHTFTVLHARVGL
ncbi:hypothetical protein K474DRAFT_703491 [Panus rudis PR-1116 ss-1]|nr:hypothetical protein K474DRAFT_703491 [Panus rudis PR-1116 ss-1]